MAEFPWSSFQRALATIAAISALVAGSSMALALLLVLVLTLLLCS